MEYLAIKLCGEYLREDVARDSQTTSSMRGVGAKELEDKAGRGDTPKRKNLVLLSSVCGKNGRKCNRENAQSKRLF